MKKIYIILLSALTILTINNVNAQNHEKGPGCYYFAATRVNGQVQEKSVKLYNCDAMYLEIQGNLSDKMNPTGGLELGKKFHNFWVGASSTWGPRKFGSDAFNSYDILLNVRWFPWMHSVRSGATKPNAVQPFIRLAGGYTQCIESKLLWEDVPQKLQFNATTAKAAIGVMYWTWGFAVSVEAGVSYYNLIKDYSDVPNITKEQFVPSIQIGINIPFGQKNKEKRATIAREYSR